jgi:hypothetical protein
MLAAPGLNLVIFGAIRRMPVHRVSRTATQTRNRYCRPKEKEAENFSLLLKSAADLRRVFSVVGNGD